MSFDAINFYDNILGRYQDGRLPIPGLVLDGILKTLVEVHYRFGVILKEMPEDWSGNVGPIAEKSDELMNIHYDRPAILFENFLGPTMKYTMGLWEQGADNLEASQVAMMDDLCGKAGIHDGDNVLDIACGFGSLSKHILERYPKAKVTALNLSTVQSDYIEARQSEPGHPMHTDRFRLLRGDFTKVNLKPEYDRIMVIGLFEHIYNLRLALEKISSFLKPGGTVLIHFIAYTSLLRTIADPADTIFFGKNIFPGARFWYFNELPRYDKHLRVEKSWFLNGKNYKRTLQAWRGNFWLNIDTIRAQPGLDQRFIRTWDLYLRFCAAIFGGTGGRTVGNGQYLLRQA